MVGDLTNSFATVAHFSSYGDRSLQRSKPFQKEGGLNINLKIVSWSSGWLCMTVGSKFTRLFQPEGSLGAALSTAL